MKTKLTAMWKIAKEVFGKWITLIGLYAGIGTCVIGVVVYYVAATIDYLSNND